MKLFNHSHLQLMLNNDCSCIPTSHTSLHGVDTNRLTLYQISISVSQGLLICYPVHNYGIVLFSNLRICTIWFIYLGSGVEFFNINACTVAAWFQRMNVVRLYVGTLIHQTPLQTDSIYSLHVTTVFLPRASVLRHQG